MPVIEHRIFIKVPIDECFDLARNVNSINDNRNRKEDLLSEGDTVTRVTATKQKITMKVIFMERPNSFVEKMIRGPFRSLIHIHQFVEEEGGTVMLDHVQYKARFGPVGAAVDKILLERLLKSFIISRSEKLKELAETLL
jgi:ligand-binding SRPBCC domain-containing protein